MVAVDTALVVAHEVLAVVEVVLVVAHVVLAVAQDMDVAVVDALAVELDPLWCGRPWPSVACWDVVSLCVLPV